MNSFSLKRLKTGAMPCRNLPPDMPAHIPMRDLSLMYNNHTLKCHDLNHFCHIPRCPNEVCKEVQETGVQYKYTSFRMKNPKFMKTNDPDRVWQTAVQKFLMDLTNQKLADTYHRDCVLVCERHFASADVSYIQGSKNLKKKLRVGAMPSLHIPDPVSRTTMESSKLLPPPLDEEPVIQHKTFASFSASVSRIAHKTWRISRKNSVIQCVKPSSDWCDQNEFILEIDKFFNIGMVYYGWCLPKDHFATTFDVRRHGLVKYLDYLEALTPCEGVKMTEDVRNSEVIDHYYTKSSKPFEYKPMVSKFLLRRSIECDVLLPAPSFGSCKACTVVNDSFKKEESIVQSQDDWSSILLEPNVADSSFCVRLKKELLKKSNKLMESMKIVQNQMNMLSQGQNQPGCKVVLLKEQTEKRKTKRSNLSKPHQETQDSEKLLHVKLITKEEYMQPILKFAKQQNLPETFSTFWQFQVGVLWKGMDNKIVANGSKYPEKILDIFADLYMKSRPAYTLLRDLKLLKMPKHESIKRHSVNRRKRVLEMKDNMLMQGGTVSDASVSTTSQATNEQPQEVHIADAATEREAHQAKCTDNVATLSVPTLDSSVVGNIAVMSVKPHPVNGAETFVFALTDDKRVTGDDKLFASYGKKRKLPNDNLDTTVLKMSRMNKDMHTCESSHQNPDEDITTPDIVIEVSVDPM